MPYDSVHCATLICDFLCRISFEINVVTDEGNNQNEI